MNGAVRFVAVAAVALACVSMAQAIDIDTVIVGNAGNADHTYGDGYGGVDYVYIIGKYEVTAGQYSKFLNAVAGDDTYGLYSISMFGSHHGCQIERIGSSPNYAYYVHPDWADRPVNFVSWGDAARFANWLHNGQPGLGAPVPQDENSTEDGSYYLNGAWLPADLMAVVRKEDATWVIPSEDEWYKAAYHYNDGVTGNYWDYPTESNTSPTSEAPPGTDMTYGSANCYWGGYAIGSPYYKTEVGTYDAKPSDSAYGTYDQGGNVWELNETPIFSYRGRRGGSYTTPPNSMLAGARDSYPPASARGNTGFRVARVSDCNDNGIFDDCDSDCGDTGGPCDVEECGQSEDCDGNGVPDECDPDCNSNGVVDACEPFTDCNDNSIPDECEEDCDGSGIPDACDISTGVSEDCNLNGVPDECEGLAANPPHWDGVAKNRYISLVTTNPGRQTAIRVAFGSSILGFVGEPGEVCENSGHGFVTLPEECPPFAFPTRTFWAAPLVRTSADAHFMDWHGVCVNGACDGGFRQWQSCSVHDDCADVVHVFDETILPSLGYDVQVITEGCPLDKESGYSAPLTMIQSRAGDVCGPGPEGACSGMADGIVDITNDVLGVLDKFANVNDLQKARADIAPRERDFIVDVATDVHYCLAAFTGTP